METITSIGQPFYLMPWGEYQFFGLTETVYDSPPEDARVLPDEVDFILAEANRLFLTLKLPPGGCGLQLVRRAPAHRQHRQGRGQVLHPA